MEENLQEQTQSQEESQVSKEPLSTINQLDKKTIIIVSACSLICFLLGLLFGIFIGGNSSSSQKQPLYQRPPLNGPSNFNPQDRFADGRQDQDPRQQRPPRPPFGGQQQGNEGSNFQQQGGFHMPPPPPRPERRQRPNQNQNQNQSQNADF